MEDGAKGAAGDYGSVAHGGKPGMPRKVFQEFHGLSGADAAKALGCTCIPPLIFMFTATVMSFKFHFTQPRGVWLIALPGIIPALVMFSVKQPRFAGIAAKWPRLAAILCFVAYFSASVFGELNYWYYAQPFFFLESLKTYSNVDPAQVSGVQLMDAGMVYFAEGARLGMDMAMSFTSWDTYCVAPITTSEGLPTQGAQLVSYDLWAVGVNCCKSAEADFRCGAFDDYKARAGLRQVSAEQRPYFRLAVQQAEAAYNIQASNPTFFYWVKDPRLEERLFFTTSFENWVLANAVHFALNAFAVLCFIMVFNKGSKDLRLSVLGA
jgi:hypothetical protein